MFGTEKRFTRGLRAHAVWPGSKFSGVFFLRWGVILAGSSSRAPRGPPSLAWAMSSSVGRSALGARPRFSFSIMIHLMQALWGEPIAPSRVPVFAAPLPMALAPVPGVEQIGEAIVDEAGERTRDRIAEK